MGLSDILNTETLSKTEEVLIQEVFSNPLVKKYLRIMGRNDLEELATISVTEGVDSEVAKKHALIVGKLTVLSTLISINKPQE